MVTQTVPAPPEDQVPTGQDEQPSVAVVAATAEDTWPEGHVWGRHCGVLPPVDYVPLTQSAHPSVASIAPDVFDAYCPEAQV